MINERLASLREEMKKRNIDFYYVPTGDYHNTENVSDYFKTRQMLSGFTGSEGSLIVGKEKAWLWVDGRYFLQAEKELKGSEIIKMEIGEPGVPTITQFLEKNFQEDSILGMDGKVSLIDFVNQVKEALNIDDNRLFIEEDLVDKIWENRPEISNEKAFFLKNCGETLENKISKFKSYMKENSIDGYVINQLDQIAWLLNMRGRDVKYFPVAFSFMIFFKEEVFLFIDTNKLSEEDRTNLEEKGIVVKEYMDFYEFLAKLSGLRVAVDKDGLDYYSYKKIGQADFIFEESPVILWKAMKNKVEIQQVKEAHLKDGVAMVKFLYWLSNQELDKLNEYQIAEKIDWFRSQQNDFIEPSFSTIVGYADNGAIIHYTPKKEKAKILDKKGLLLIDSGGQYLDGTTDVTRTISLGPLKEKEKDYYTAVLRGMIRLGKAKFLEGCRGVNLDILARGVLWDMDLDYKHGTGHGIGHILNVHEGPIGIRWRTVAGLNDSEILREGMILSNEPGVYIEEEFGIRIENQMLIRPLGENSYGKFMDFDHLTLIPIDKKPIVKENMLKDEIEWLNSYHNRVYNSLEKFLSKAERIWLKEATSPL